MDGEQKTHMNWVSISGDIILLVAKRKKPTFLSYKKQNPFILFPIKI